MQRINMLIGYPVTRTYSNRVLKRMRGHPRTWPQKGIPSVPPPQFPVQPVKTLPSGYIPQLSSSSLEANGTRNNLPFKVSRTSVGKQLPVYTDYRNGRTRTLTLIRKITGDTAVMSEEIRRVTGGAEVSVHPGRIEIEGNRSQELKLWLAGLGF